MSRCSFMPAALATVALCLAGCAGSRAGDPDADDLQLSQPPLVTGKSIEDHFADATQDVGSLPINLVTSPDGRFAISTDAGYREAVWAIRMSDGKGTGHVSFPNSVASRQRKT
ncbi:MAG: hypothetical protein ACHRHE_17770, partial [Tepidisphaerales bacterium]